jgi:hypothetical protein
MNGILCPNEKVSFTNLEVSFTIPVHLLKEALRDQVGQAL